MILSDEQIQFQEAARKFADAELKPYAAAWEETGLPDELIKKLGELGYLGLLTKNEFDGSELDYLTYALIIEELARGDAATSTLVSVHNSVCCLPIEQFGTEQQKAQFLSDLAKGNIIGAFALTEPGAGSDAAQIKCRAERKGDHYILNGTKQFITNGKRCGLAIVFAVTDPKAGKKGISAFIVPKGLPGFEVTKLEDKLGIRASDTAQLVFQDCALPSHFLLGQEGEGLKIALSNLEGGRIGIAAQAIGIAQAALDMALNYADQRQTFGKKLSAHQALAFRLADMATEIEAARSLVWRAAMAKMTGQPALKLAAMAKLKASEMAERVVSEALQIHGGYGFLKDFPIERLYRDVRITRIYEGASDIQRLIIARELIPI